jgi:hypothetical protein
MAQFCPRGELKPAVFAPVLQGRGGYRNSDAMSGRGPTREGAGPEEDGERLAGEPKAKLATSFDELRGEAKPLKALKRTTYSMRSLRESWGPSDRGVEHAVCAPLACSSSSAAHQIPPLQLRKIPACPACTFIFFSFRPLSSHHPHSPAPNAPSRLTATARLLPCRAQTACVHNTQALRENCD